ncbi:hypothetical protein D3C72_2498470 [compost metagenome]
MSPIEKLSTLTGPSTLTVSVKTLPVAVLSSLIVTDSLASRKSSFTGVTPMFSVEVSFVPEPSVTV